MLCSEMFYQPSDNFPYLLINLEVYVRSMRLFMRKLLTSVADNICGQISLCVSKETLFQKNNNDRLTAVLKGNFNALK